MIVRPEFEAKLVRVGNSLGVRIPAEWVKVIQAQQGDRIKLEITGHDGATRIRTFGGFSVDSFLGGSFSSFVSEPSVVSLIVECSEGVPA